MSSHVGMSKKSGLSAFSGVPLLNPSESTAIRREAPSHTQSRLIRSSYVARILQQGLAFTPAATSAAHLSQEIESGYPLEEAVSRLAPSERSILLNEVGVRRWDSLLSLTQERDATIFRAGLAWIAQDCVDDQLALGAAFFRELSSDTSGLSDATSRRAQLQLDALEGRGAWGPRLAGYAHRVFNESTRLDLLAGMTVAAPLFQALRFGSLGLMLGSPGWRNAAPLAIEALAYGIGFTGELGAFTLTMRGVNEALGRSQNWTASALQEDFLLNGIGLLAMKLSGGAAQSALSRIQGNLPLQSAWMRFSEIALPQAAILTGLLGAHALESRFGLRPPQSFSDAFVESLGMLLPFHLSGHLSQRFWSPTLHRGFQEIDLRLRQVRLASPQGVLNIGEFSHWATVEGPLPANVHMSSEDNGPRNTGLSSAHPLAIRASEPPKNPRSPLGDALWIRGTRRLAQLADEVAQFQGAAEPSLWLHQSHRLGAELAPLLQVLQTRLESSPGFATESVYFKHLISESLRIQWLTENPRHPAGSSNVDSISADFNRLTRNGLHGLEAFLQTGKVEALQDSYHRFSDARQNLQEFLNISDAELCRLDLEQSIPTHRLYFSPQNPEIDLAQRPYQAVPEGSDPSAWLEIAGENRHIVLTGNVPLHRLELSRRHEVKYLGSGVEDRTDFFQSVSAKGIDINPRRVSMTVWDAEREALGADYLEAYDYTSRDRLESAWGPQFVTKLIQKLRPGGVGFIVMQDPLALRAFIRHATHEGQADILSGAFGAPLPVRTGTSEEFVTNHIFIRRLLETATPLRAEAPISAVVETAALSSPEPRTVRLHAESATLDESYQDYPIPNAEVAERIKSHFGQMEMEIYKLYNEYQRHRDWVGRAQEIVLEMIPLVKSTEQTVRFFRPEQSAQAEFDQITQGLTNISRLLRELQGQPSVNLTTNSALNFKIEEFLRNIYRCNNRFGNYLHNNATLPPILETVDSAQHRLEEYLERRKTP